MGGMEHVHVQGCRLEVHTVPAPAGSHLAAPVVFLHEGLGSVSMWREWPAEVGRATGRAVVTYSRRGYGQSDPVPEVRTTGRLPPDYLHREAWEVLPALLEQLGLVQPVLLGHSDGASIALLHAARFPVRACIAMAPHVMVEDQSIQSIAQAREAFLHGDLRARLARHHADVNGAFWQWNDAWLNPAFRGFDIRADCTRITAPVLALQGDKDPYGTMAQIDQIDLPAHRIRRVALAGCGHSPHREAPAATLAAAVDFLSRID
jgi:pimeloyl-ACP methyl ester carboxylesterase